MKLGRLSWIFVQRRDSKNESVEPGTVRPARNSATCCSIQAR
jgi:hypothetical protein